MRIEQVVKDAIALLHWQSREPIGSTTWAEWVGKAIDALDEIESPRGRPMIEGDL
jgi:hypothetical protein